MTPPAEGFPYLQVNAVAGAASLSPYLPLELLLGEKRVSATGLVDGGAAINVLPYDLGLRLGAIWEHQTTSVQLTGNLTWPPTRSRRYSSRKSSL